MTWWVDAAGSAVCGRMQHVPDIFDDPHMVRAHSAETSGGDALRLGWHGDSAVHTPMHTGNGVLTFRCDDQLGVVSTLADVIQEHRANMISLDLMIGRRGQCP